MRMKKWVIVVLIMAVLVGIGSLVVRAASMPCYDIWRACTDMHGYTDECERMWQNCMDVMYPAR